MMLKHTQPLSALDNKEQLMRGLLASVRTLLVSLSFVVLFVVLFVKAIVGFGMVALAAMNMVCEWIVSLVTQSDEVSCFFLSTMRGTP